jgi:uncharacterized membrane protein HdeD (DUF308 family)
MGTGEWLKTAHRNAGRLVALGVVEIVLGLVVLSAPLVVGLALSMVIGLGLMLGGVVRLVAAFAADSFGSGALAFLWGLLVAAAGFYVFAHPGLSLAALTLALAMMFFVSGLTECVVAFQAKPAEGWGWVLAGGIVSVVLALMVWRQFPVSGSWLVGTLVGINLLVGGVRTLMIGGAARRATAAAGGRA